MSTLSSLASRLQAFATGSTRPDRDALAAERDQLRAAPPPATPEFTLTRPLERATERCRCADCTTREQAEDGRRAAYLAYVQRLTAIETQLYRLSFGDEAERDSPGQALVELRGDLLRAHEAVRGRPWERRIEEDGRGKPIRAWETTTAIAAILGELRQLARSTDAMVYLPRAELTAALQEARDQMGALLVRPLEAPLDVELAARAGTQKAEAPAGEQHGLTPAPASPNTLEGTIRFRRRGRA